MAVHDIATYGTLFTRARRSLAGNEPTFMAQLRRKD